LTLNSLFISQVCEKRLDIIALNHCSATMMYIRRETTKHMMMAHRRQFLLRASLSRVFALFFIENAVSLMFDDLDTISYVAGNIRSAQM